MSNPYPTTTDPKDWSREFSAGVDWINRDDIANWFAAAMQAMHDHLAPLQSKDWVDKKVFDAEKKLQALEEHISIAFHPDIGWAHSPEEYTALAQKLGIAQARVRELEGGHKISIALSHNELASRLDYRASIWREKALRTQDPIRIDIDNLMAVHCEELAEDLREVLK